MIDGTRAAKVFAVRPIPAGVPKLGHGKNATRYGYRIPSLLTTRKGTVIAFIERRLGLHDHAQNDIVLKRSTDGGKTWGKEIVAFVKVIKVCSSTLDASNAKEVKEALSDSLTGEKQVFSLDNLEFIDSSGLGTLLYSMRNVTAKGGTLKLSGAQAAVKLLLDQVQFYRLIDIHPSEEEAIASF